MVEKHHALAREEILEALTSYTGVTTADGATPGNNTLMGRQVSGDACVNYDYNTAYQSWYELNALALEATNNGDEAAARRYEKLRDQMVGLSPLLTSPYFDPSTE